MDLTLKSIIETLVENDELDLARCFISIKLSKYANAMDILLAKGLNDNLIKELGLKPNTPTPPTVEEKTRPSEIYLLSDFRTEKLEHSQVKQSELTKLYSKLKPEQKMILLTLAWAKRPSTSAFIIKHCQRISCYFRLDQDVRWRSYYDNNRTKMQSLITNTISKYKKSGIVIENKLSTLTKQSVYSLSDLGLSLSRMIANEVGFSLDSAI